jgi:hypothetical protein
LLQGGDQLRRVVAQRAGGARENDCGQLVAPGLDVLLAEEGPHAVAEENQRQAGVIGPDAI